MKDVAAVMQSPKEDISISFKDPWQTREDAVERYQKEDNPVLRINIRMNSFRCINEVLKDCNKTLDNGDFILGYFESLVQRKRRIRKGKSLISQKLVMQYDFWVRRVLPKVPGIRYLDRRFHLIRNRSLSRCEMLGRLRFNGFEIVEFRNDEEYFYFKAKKVKEPISTENEYDVFIKLPRVGKNGKIFNVYKLRTMHPYASYIHDYLIENHGFSESGKIKDDFRISDWGRIVRKLWFDELPQLINLLKGDITLVGVRPISMTMYSTYPKDLRESRIQIKPGLIPPYYVDLPKDMDEVHESERKYIKLKMERPFHTDVDYFIKAMHNILIKGARSG